MLAPLEIWQQLLDDEHAPLLEQAAGRGSAQPNSSNAPTLNTLTKLRKQFDPDLVAVALQLTEARHRASVKFPDHAAGLLADVEGVEQASSMLVAAHKARRFAAVATPNRSRALVDLCCGIGGDAIAFTDAGLDVTAIDADPVRTFMAQHNARCQTQCIDVETWLATPGGTGIPPVVGPDGQATHDIMFHIDPARRSAAGRAWNLADYTPGPAFLRQLLARVPTGAIKLGPGIHHDELATELTDHLPSLPFELEFISEHGRLVQAVLWTGDLAHKAPQSHPLHTATLLPSNATLTGEPGEPPINDIERYLYTVDAAAERAQLLHVLCDQHHLHAIHPALGMLTSPEPIDSPWLTAFEFIEALPWRMKKVKAWLQANNAGIVEVKTRGKAINPDIVQPQLRGKGDEAFTVFILHFDEQVRAIITRRVPLSLQ